MASNSVAERPRRVLAGVARTVRATKCHARSALTSRGFAVTPPTVDYSSIATEVGTPTWFATGVQMSSVAASVSIETMRE